MTIQTIKTNTDKNYLNFLKQAEKVGKTVFVNKHILSNVCHTPDGKVYTTDSHRAYIYIIVMIWS